MNKWRETTLDEIAIVNPTESLKKGTKAKKIAMDALQPFTKIVPEYSIEEYNGGMKFKNGDTIVARITPCLENGKTAYIDILNENEIGFGSTEFIVLREKQNISDKHFLYYFAISSEFRDIAILSMTGSSGRQRVQTDVVKNHSFLLPPLPEQRTIASVLSSLDDKIDLLHRENRTLEAMAETLFRQWFIEEADERWETDFLHNIIDLQRGISYSTNTLGEYGNGIPMHSLNSIDIHGSYKYDGIKYYKGAVKENQLLKAGDLLIINTDITQENRIIGWPIFIPNEFPESVCTHHLYSTTLKTNKVSKLYLCYLLRHRDYREALANSSNGTTVSMLSKEAIGNITIKIPPQEKIKTFEATVIFILNKLTINQSQQSSLEKLRDTLLPKLMSGEVRVAV